MFNMENNSYFTCTWRIENFELLFFDIDGKYFECPVFAVRALMKTKWKLMFEIDRSLNCYISLRREDKGEPLNLNFSLAFLNCDGKVIDSKMFEIKNFNQQVTHDKYFYSYFTLLELMRDWSEDTLIVRCRMFDSAFVLESTVISGCEVRSSVDVRKGLFEKKVKANKTSEWSENIVFPNLDFPRLNIDFSFPKQLIGIQFLDGKPLETGRIIVTFLNSQRKKVYLLTTFFPFPSSILILDFPSFIPNSNVTACSEWFELTLICEMMLPTNNKEPFSTIEKYYTQVQSSVQYVGQRSDNSSTLQKDLRNLINNEKYSDVVLRVEEEEIPVHKNILASRSLVFAAMFDQDMLETQTGAVDIKDVDVETMKLFLRFMYTDEVEGLDVDSALSLVVVADKYQVMPLKEKCASFLMSALTEENAWDIISVAELVQHEALKTSTIEFFNNNAAEIFSMPNGPQWVEKNSKLASKLLFEIAFALSRTE